MAEENIKKILKSYKEETIRHFDVVAEDLGDKIKQVTEGVSSNSEKLKEHDERFNKIDQKLENIDVRLTSIEETESTIKLDLEFIKNGLKQKVDQDEFAVLERRVSMLEAKINQKQ